LFKFKNKSYHCTFLIAENVTHTFQITPYFRSTFQTQKALLIHSWTVPNSSRGINIKKVLSSKHFPWKPNKCTNMYFIKIPTVKKWNMTYPILYTYKIKLYINFLLAYLKRGFVNDIYLKHKVSNNNDGSSQNMSQCQYMNFLQAFVGRIFWHFIPKEHTLQIQWILITMYLTECLYSLLN
jgi:hypothetical protein